MDVERLPRVRPPCSKGELAAAAYLRARLQQLGLRCRIETFRAPTSPTWVPLTGAVLRLCAAAVLLSDLPGVGLGLAAPAFAIALLPAVASRLFAHLPWVGGRSVNVLAALGRGTSGGDPLIVAAHLDTHPTAGAPLARPHLAVTATSGAGLMAAAAAAIGQGGAPPWVLVVLGTEALVTMVRLAGWALQSRTDSDDNDSGVAALVRVADLATEETPARSVWLAGTGAATTGSWGMRALLRAHPDLARAAWVVDMDALGDAELVVRPARRRLPRRKTPAEVVRAVAGSAIESGDVVAVRRVRRPHSDADAAVGRGVPAVTITGRNRSRSGADPANVERAARIVDRLARTAH